MRKRKEPPPPMTQLQIAQAALSMIRSQQRGFNLPDDYKEWLKERREDLEQQITTQQFLPLKAT